MKIIVVGDVHGRNCWEKVKSVINDFDKIVFVGDYFDSFYIKTDEQIKNMKAILDFKRENYDKVVLLFGNHDTHYLKLFISNGEYYSGFQSVRSLDISEIVETELFNLSDGICYHADGVIYSHAGITKTWVKRFNLEITKEEPVKHINNLFNINQSICGFAIGANYSRYGDDVCQSPIWVRPRSLRSDSIDGYKQVVGHTHHTNITIDGDFAFVDSQDTNEDEFLVVDNGEFSIIKIDNIG